ncbi:protein mono-ADP-ribosyltransferase PARP15-like isoform X2 [Phyllobates terribilis]|uniref:protein mono-ADP-ribosyltransferase PARP15-like isoform X2 n=1 Tax=Phyllobates terribilis TaxID=111132 RepID=UPI003CCACB8B
MFHTERKTSSSEVLLNSQGVSKAILDAAGPDVKEECRILAKHPNDGYVVTSAGNMKCRKIIHLIDVHPHNFVASMMKALKACDKNDMATVSLPLIGTRTNTLGADASIRYIVKGIKDYLSDPSVMTVISEIVIIVYEKDNCERYQQFFQNYKKNYPHFSAFGKILELIKGDITHHIVDCVVNLTNASMNRSFGVSRAILRAAGDTVKKECKKLGTLKEDGVAITSGGNLGSKKIMHIIGPTRVPAYQPSIDRVLRECHKEGFKSVALPAIGTGMARINVEESITAILSSILNYLSDTLIPSLETIFIIVMDENIYKKYLEVFQAKSTELQKHQRIERIVAAICQGGIFPTTWNDMVNSEFMEVILKETSQEYKDVENKFFQSILKSKYEIIQIKRIQNVKLWQSFTVNKNNVEKKNPLQENITHLYHGTKSNAISNINRHGFNRVYCGENGTAYGNGTYFAVESRYSCRDRYSCPDPDGKKYIYQVAVITGRYCMGHFSYKEAPHVDGDPNKGRYDSVADDVKYPKMFAVFHDDVAYPEYLITFKKC